VRSPIKKKEKKVKGKGEGKKPMSRKKEVLQKKDLNYKKKKRPNVQKKKRLIQKKKKKLKLVNKKDEAATRARKKKKKKKSDRCTAIKKTRGKGGTRFVADQKRGPFATQKKKGVLHQGPGEGGKWKRGRQRP